MPGWAARLGPRIKPNPSIDWSANGLGLDSLARMHLATAAATWCNAYDAGFEDLFLAKRNTCDWAAVMQRARASGAAHFTFSSSGSAGVRKHIRHREDVLTQEARAWVQVLEPSAFGTPASVKRVVVLAPTHHIYGFIWGVLLPMALGVDAIDADIANMPAVLTGDLLVAVPDQWTYLANLNQAWPADVQGISSTAPLADAVHRKLITHHSASGPAPGQATETAPLARLLQIYGSSETAGLAWRDDPALPYTLTPGRTRRADDEIFLQLPDGRQALMPVQDELKWTSATQFELLRRTDGSVQVGGQNVSPQWVAQHLQTHPMVKHAAVRLDPLAAAPKLKAYVVLHSPADAPECQAFEAWALDTLPWYAALGSVTYGEALPLNAMGKLSDRLVVGPPVSRPLQDVRGR